MLTAEEAIEAVAPSLGYTPTRQQIAMAFLDVDQTAVTAGVKKRVKWEQWDKETPINNVPAEQIMAARDDYTGGEVYLIYIDGDLVFFQPTSPTDGASITEDDIASTAKAHVATIVEDLAQDALVEALVAAIPTRTEQLPVVEPIPLSRPTSDMIVAPPRFPSLPEV